ncbi:ABC transporter permease [Amnibacterium setariae]|uniref:ABC transporter permease n=1 Tax=Amnibacterium setariae TaxID=2306585 RepID=A0A3A1TXA3_9MICO|nr:ABC transporter permease [Amnibacterium setariae]RIX28201.1 ABC transporter permease [Amnibacterium setariae]
MLFLQAIQWILDPEHWAAVNFQAGIAEELGAHLWLSFLALVFTAAVALPVGLYIGHTGRGRGFAIVVANVVRAVPTLGLLSVLLLVSLALPPAVFVFVLLGVPPLLAGAYAGLEAVDRQTIDASRAMGMTEWQILRRVELPLAAPLILGGLRGATLQIIASVTLVSNFGINSLGDFILGGLAANDYVQMTAGAILVTVLALLVDGLLAVVQRFAAPRGVSRGRGTTTARGRRLSVPTGTPVSEGN